VLLGAVDEVGPVEVVAVVGHEHVRVALADRARQVLDELAVGGLVGLGEHLGVAVVASDRGDDDRVRAGVGRDVRVVNLEVEGQKVQVDRGLEVLLDGGHLHRAGDLVALGRLDPGPGERAHVSVDHEPVDEEDVVLARGRDGIHRSELAPQGGHVARMVRDDAHDLALREVLAARDHLAALGCDLTGRGALQRVRELVRLGALGRDGVEVRLEVGHERGVRVLLAREPQARPGAAVHRDVVDGEQRALDRVRGFRARLLRHRAQLGASTYRGGVGDRGRPHPELFVAFPPASADV
jgi:hypothetical protein